MAFVFSVRNWEGYQHYKYRSPTWVKLHRDLLTSEAWLLGTDLSRLVQVASLMLAARYSNNIPREWRVLKRVANLDCSEKQFDEALTHLIATNFLEIQALPNVEQDASTALAKCSSSRVEKSREDAASASISVFTKSVFEHWQHVWSHPNTKLDAKRQKVIRARLADFTPEQLCHAIEGYRASRWHCGDNPTKTVYDGLSTLLRDNEQVEKGLQLYRPIEEQPDAPPVLPDGRENPPVSVNGHRVRSFVVGPQGQIGQNIRAVVWEGA